MASDRDIRLLQAWLDAGSPTTDAGVPILDDDVWPDLPYPDIHVAVSPEAVDEVMAIAPPDPDITGGELTTGYVSEVAEDRSEPPPGYIVRTGEADGHWYWDVGQHHYTVDGHRAPIGAFAIMPEGPCHYGEYKNIDDAWAACKVHYDGVRGVPAPTGGQSEPPIAHYRVGPTDDGRWWAAMRPPGHASDDYASEAEAWAVCRAHRDVIDAERAALIAIIEMLRDHKKALSRRLAEVEAEQASAPQLGRAFSHGGFAERSVYAEVLGLPEDTALDYALANVKRHMAAAAKAAKRVRELLRVLNKTMSEARPQGGGAAEREFISDLAAQHCCGDAEGSAHDYHCPDTGACITEWCWPCRARALLATSRPPVGGEPGTWVWKGDKERMDDAYRSTGMTLMLCEALGVSASAVRATALSRGRKYAGAAQPEPVSLPETQRDLERLLHVAWGQAKTAEYDKDTWKSLQAAVLGRRDRPVSLPEGARLPDGWEPGIEVPKHTHPQPHHRFPVSAECKALRRWSAIGPDGLVYQDSGACRPPEVAVWLRERWALLTRVEGSNG